MAVVTLYHSVLSPFNEDSRKIKLHIFQHKRDGHIGAPYVSYRLLKDNKGSDDFISISVWDMNDLLHFMSRLTPVSIGNQHERIEFRQDGDGYVIEVVKKGKSTQQMAFNTDEMQAILFSEQHIKKYLSMDVCD